MYIFKKVTQIPRTSSKKSSQRSALTNCETAASIAVRPSVCLSIRLSVCLSRSVMSACVISMSTRTAHNERKRRTWGSFGRATATTNKSSGRGSRVNDSDVAAQKHSQEQRALLSFLHASRIGANANFAVGVAAACVHIFVSPCCSPGAPVRVPVWVCVCEYVLLLCLSRLVVWPLDKIVCACSLPTLPTLLRALN